MAESFLKQINGYAVNVLVWEEVGWIIKYGAQVTCPLCESFYNTTNKMTKGKATSAVMNGLSSHYKRKHK